MKYPEMMKVSRLVACPMFFNLPCHLSRQTGLLKLTKKSLILSMFRRLGCFPQVFGQVEMWLIIELRKIIRVSHAVACPICIYIFF